MTNLLYNHDFEVPWSEEESHHCHVYPVDGNEPYVIERGEVFNPPGWTTFAKHGLPVEHDRGNNVGWALPEVCQAPHHVDARRVHSGDNGMLLFTFYRIHDCGLLTQVSAEVGVMYKASVMAHAWSSQDDNAETSESASGSFFALASAPGLNSDHQNFTFRVGIDPFGGTDPYANTVEWGPGAHIYNTYHEVPPVYAVAESNTITVFLRSSVKWPFKHCDAYFDLASLEKVEVQTPTPVPPTPTPTSSLEDDVRAIARDIAEEILALIRKHHG